MNTAYLLASTYTALSPTANMASAICRVNGEVVPCPQFLTVLGPVAVLAVFALSLLIIVAMWRIFSKAGKPGWASIIPVYNAIVWLEIIKKPIWWIFLLFIPLVNIVIIFIMAYELAKAFGKEIGFAFGLFFIPVVFYPILGFGKSTYKLASQSDISTMPPVQTAPIAPVQYSTPTPTPTPVPTPTPMPAPEMTAASVPTPEMATASMPIPETPVTMPATDSMQTPPQTPSQTPPTSSL